MEYFSEATLRRNYNPSSDVSAEAAADAKAQAHKVHRMNPATLAFVIPAAARMMTVAPSRFSRFAGSNLVTRVGAAITIGALVWDAVRTYKYYSDCGFNSNVANKAAASNVVTTALFSGLFGSAITAFGCRMTNLSIDMFRSHSLYNPRAGPIASSLAVVAAYSFAIYASHKFEEDAINMKLAGAAHAIDVENRRVADSAFVATELSAPLPGAYLPAFPNQMILEASPRLPVPQGVGATRVPYLSDVKADLEGKASTHYETSWRSPQQWAEYAYATPAESKYDIALGLNDRPGPVTDKNINELAGSAISLVKEFYQEKK